MRNMMHHTQVVSNEQIRQMEFSLRFFEDIQNLRLDRNV
jgi:hypothetical protein